jgi:hypothetical protein
MTSLKSHLTGSTKLTPADPLKADFRNFLWLLWKHLNLPEPTPVQYDIATFLQTGPRRLGILAFRGVGKSFVTAAFVCWLLYCNPQTKILVVSASKMRADNFSTFVLDLIHSVPQLQHLIPRDDQRQSKVAFDVGPATPDQSPSVLSLGVTSQIAGTRADVIVADDVEVPNNSATSALREKLAERVKEFDAVLKPGGRIVYLGTPQDEQSLYNALPERGYVFRIWPALFPQPEQRGRYGAKLAPLIANLLDKNPELSGKPTDIKRFTEADLEERRLSYGKQGFALQFQLDTSLSDADRYPLKLGDFITYPLDPTKAPTDFMWASGPTQGLDLPAVGLQGDRWHKPGWVSPDAAPYQGSVMFVDPSGRGKDETAYAVVKTLFGRFFLVASGGFLDGYSDTTLRALLAIAKRHEVNLIKTEPNYGGGMFSKLLQGAAQRHYPVRVEDAKWSQVAKEKRIIDTLEPVLAQHRLVVCPSVVEHDLKSTEEYPSDKQNHYRLFYQLARITAQTGALAQDDRLDALAGAIAHWVDSAARDTELAAKGHKDDLLDKELKRMMGHMVAIPKRETGFPLPSTGRRHLGSRRR